VVEIAQHIRQSLKLEEILNTTVSEVRQFLQVDRVFIYRFEPDWGGVVVVECRFRLETYSRKQTQRPQLCPNFSPALQTRSYQATADIYAAV